MKHLERLLIVWLCISIACTALYCGLKIIMSQYWFLVILIIVLLVVLTGCTNSYYRPYAEAGVSYKLSETYIRPSAMGCDYGAHGELGVENPNKLSIGVRHISTWDCGIFSGREGHQEPITNELFIKKKIGGY